MDIVCITNKKIAEENSYDFYLQIERIAKAKPKKIILREKELSEREYEQIAKKCLEICQKYNIDFAINKFINAAKNLQIKNIHLSMSDFIDRREELDFFDCIGVSVHSAYEAAKAEKLGANYIIAGHIFRTDCKKGVPPRGISFLREVCENVTIPVYAIGGINFENVFEIKKTSANGVCLMSSLMKSENPENILEKLNSV